MAWLVIGVCGALVARAPAAAPPQARRPDVPTSLAAMQQLVDRLQRQQLPFDERTAFEAQVLLGDLAAGWSPGRSEREDACNALLDLTGMTLAWYDPGAVETLRPAWVELRAATVAELHKRFNGDLVQFLSRHVLANAGSQPLPRRRAAAYVLIGRRIPGTELALLTAARDVDARLRSIALEALVGFPSDVVHRFFVEEFLRADETAATLRLLAERHLRSVQFPEKSAAIEGLVRIVRRELIVEDWRRASQAAALSHALPDEHSVPWLIEALARWKARGEQGGQALRVEYEILHELEQRSGRKLGLEPENWLAWWEAYRKGTIKKSATPAGWPEPTRPSFFGLQPNSDRVLFVIDRSGSMAAEFVPGPTTGPAGRPPGRSESRWQEATQQLVEFARSLGERAKFNVVVFHDFGDPWKSKLVTAKESNLAAVRQWLTAQRPQGGTQLRAGIELGLEIGPDGEPDLAELEADTLIVLCDGATVEGPGWVQPFLARVNPRLRVVFHCVQIGEGGDGTLERLAAGTGGQFVRVTR